jgi:capsular exopolysaccharide synthesis family protein
MMRREDARLEGPLDIRDFTTILLRRKWLILAIALPVIGAAALYSYSRTPVYTATARILVRPALSNITDVIRPTDISAQTETNLATSVAVAEVARGLMNPAPALPQLLKNVSAAMSQGTQVLSVSYSDPNPVQAQQGTKAFADAYLKYREQQALDMIQQRSDTILTQLQTVRQQIGTVSAQIQALPQGSPERANRRTTLALLNSRSLALQSQLVSLQTITIDPGEVIDPANLPASPASPRHEFDLAIGILLGLGLGVAVALVRERSSDVVRTPVELEESLGAPVLASIPTTGWHGRERTRLMVADGRRTPAADGYRRLRTGLLSTVSSDTKTVLITSAGSGEGKTATVVNLGAGLAEIGRRVIIVAADLRRPALHRLFATNDSVGLSQVLSDGVSASKVIQATAIPNLLFVPTGSLSMQLEPVNLLQTERMRDLLAECGRNADFVLLDSPAVLGVPDTLVLARLVDAVVFVADARKTRWEEVTLAREQLERAGGVPTAGVLNGVEVSRRYRRTWGIHGQLLHVHERMFSSRERVQSTGQEERPVEDTSVPQPTGEDGDGSHPSPEERDLDSQIEARHGPDADVEHAPLAGRRAKRRRSSSRGKAQPTGEEDRPVEDAAAPQPTGDEGDRSYPSQEERDPDPQVAGRQGPDGEVEHAHRDGRRAKRRRSSGRGKAQPTGEEGPPVENNSAPQPTSEESDGSNPVPAQREDYPQGSSQHGPR